MKPYNDPSKLELAFAIALMVTACVALWLKWS